MAPNGFAAIFTKGDHPNHTSKALSVGKCLEVKRYSGELHVRCPATTLISSMFYRNSCS